VTDRLIALQSEAPDDLLVLQWTLLESAFAPLGEGRWEEAQQRIERAIELNRRRGQSIHHAPFGAALCWLHRSRGEYELAVRAGREAAESARELGHAEWAAWADADLGWALLESGAAGEAVEVLERGAKTAETVGAPNPRARCTSLLAWGRCLLGDRARAAEALAAAEDALAVVEPPADHAWLFGGHAYLAVGRAHVDLGDPEAAQTAATQVAEPAERAGWREVIAGAALVRGQAHAATDDASRASEALTRALAVAETTGLPFIADEARAAADNL
jgi:tetratricopeptide (TPR) repeat protein